MSAAAHDPDVCGIYDVRPHLGRPGRGPANQIAGSFEAQLARARGGRPPRRRKRYDRVLGLLARLCLRRPEAVRRLLAGRDA